MNIIDHTYKKGYTKSNCIQPIFESKEESKIESKSEQNQEYEFVSNDLFVQEIDDKLLNEELY